MFLQQRKSSFMKLFLIKVFIFISVFTNVKAKEYEINYSLSTSGIKIGSLSWVLKINDDKYFTEIKTKNTGLLSTLYKFEGIYTSRGLFVDNKFESRDYKQTWKTRKKTKIVEMSFNKYLIKLIQNPVEKETSRVDLNNLFEYFDPITSFINILNGRSISKTVDGRRIYIMQRFNSENINNIEIKILDYKNIWTDHQRNDLEKIEFILNEDLLLPKNINIYFKNKVFKLKTD